MNSCTDQKVECNTYVLADKLNALLKKHRVNVSQVAQALSMPTMTISRLVSGKTEDPRISTLKLIANYFNISIDSLLDETKAVNLQPHHKAKAKPRFVPILDWSTIENTKAIDDLNLNDWKEWQPVSSIEQDEIGENAFALESRPSMYPRFPQGTIFIFNPNIEPKDGDIVLVKIKKNNELTLRELTIDPPEWQLNPIVPGSKTLQYNSQHYEIVGISVLIMLYNRKGHA